MSFKAEGGDSQGGSGKAKADDWTAPAPPEQVSGGPTTSTWTRGVWFPQPGASGSILFPGRQSQKLDVPDRPAPAYGYYPATQLGGAWEFLDPVDRTFFDVVAKAGSSRSTGEGLYRDLLAESERFNALSDSKVSPFDLLKQVAEQRGIMDSTGQITEAGADLYQSLAGGPSGSSGSGAYTGPVSQTTFMDERDVNKTANALALELIGRPLSQKELAKVTKRLRSEEAANPTVSTRQGPGGSVTQSGLSADGRADVLREVIAENPEYQQFQVDTTVLDTMLAQFKKREQMVNG